VTPAENKLNEMKFPRETLKIKCHSRLLRSFPSFPSFLLPVIISYCA